MEQEAAATIGISRDEEKGTVTIESEPPIPWDDPREKRNPKHWGLPQKIFHSAIPCLIAFEVTLSTSVTVPAAGAIAAEFSVSRTQSLLPLTLYTLGLAFGPLFLAPFSEVFGRKSLYVSTLSFLLLFTGAGGAAPNFSTLLACRFLAGFLGSAGMAIGGGTVADIWSLQKAGGTVALLFILGPFLGPVLGPLAGTYILEGHGNDWKWTQWLIIMIGAPIFVGAVLMKETSKQHILRHEVLPGVTPEKASVVVQAGRKVKIAIFRSVKMLTTDIVVFSLSIYTAYTYALTFSYFASVPYVFPRYYGMTPKETSLMFLSITIGYIFAIFLFAYFDRTLYARARAAAEGGMPAPEHRLYSALAGSVFLPIGLFWYAWAAQKGGHWAALAASGIPFGLGAFSIFLSAINYLVDVYQAAGAASALAANGSVRFILGAVFPLFTVQMYDRLGIHWAGSVFAFLSVCLLPIPWLLMRYGPTLRARSNSKK